MATEVNLPELGESVTEGTVTRWLKQEGDDVAVDEPLLEVSTDKVDTEIPSPVAGVLLEIRAHEDDTVEVGGALALIGSADEQGGGDSGGDDGGQSEESAQAEESEQAAESEQAEQAAEPAQTEGSADTPLDEEKAEREQAHDQAEQADTPGEGPARDESAQDEAAEAPREEVAAATASAS